MVTLVPDTEPVLLPYLNAEAGWLSLLCHCTLTPSSTENIGTDLRFAPWLLLQDTKPETQNTLFPRRVATQFKKNNTFNWYQDQKVPRW